MQRGFASIILIIVVLFIGAVGGAYYLGKTNKNTDSSPNSSSTPTASSAPASTSSPMSDETASWKSYRNTKLNLEFKYPESWHVSDYIDQYGFVIVAPTPIKIPEGTDAPLEEITIGFNRCTDTVTNQDFPCDKSIDDRVNSWKSYLVESTYKESVYAISGKTGKQVEGEVKPDLPGSRYIKQTIFPYGEYLLLAILDKEDKEVVYDQILSTFKFTP